MSQTVVEIDVLPPDSIDVSVSQTVIEVAFAAIGPQGERGPPGDTGQIEWASANW